MTKKIVEMRTTITRERLVFTVYVNGKLKWRQTWAMMPPNSAQYHSVEQAQRFVAWRHAHDD